jgi:hypothetical protein
MSNGSYTTSFFSNELGNRNLTSTEPPTIGSVAIFSAARLATRDTGAKADTTARKTKTTRARKDIARSGVMLKNGFGRRLL